MVVLKTKDELAAMRTACRISAEALRLGGAAVRPGITTGELDRLMHEYILSQGATASFKAEGFPNCACISLNDEVIHGIPRFDRVVQPGDLVKIDVGACYRGFHGDNAGTFAAGQASPQAQALMQATRQALALAIQAAVPGARLGDVGWAVQNHVESQGFYVVRKFVGHGIGHDLHEEPEVPNFGRPGHGVRLAPGMTLAIEPMVNIGGSDVKTLPDGWTVKTKSGGLSAHFEHTIAVTKNGPVILTEAGGAD